MPRSLRDSILFFSGLAGVMHQTLIGPVEPTLLLLFAGMMGLPAVIRADEKEK